MKESNKETYWSQFTSAFEEKQSYVTGKEIIILMIEELLKEQDPGTVLELGCGTGLYTEALQKIAKKIVATDFSDEMIETAIQKRGHLENVIFTKADALNLPFEKERFDTVFMANLIHVIGDADKVIKESNRVLRKGGCLIITSFAIDEMNFFNKISLLIKYLKTFGRPSKESTKGKTTKKSVGSLLINNGFEISKSKVLGKKMKAIYISGIKNT